MYPTFSLLNHNCVCNTRTRKFIQDGNNIIELEAMVIIKKGEEICTRYEQQIKLGQVISLIFDKCSMLLYGDDLAMKPYIPHKSLLQMSCVITQAQLFLTLEVIEAVGGQK